ncbi:MAG: sulfatase-like hydrolase/transferase, partial [Halanaerobiales bacterium]
QIPPQDKTDHPVLNYQWATKNCNRDLPEEHIREIRKTYLAMVATLDEMLGNFLTEIKDMGLNESTYIIFTSDHGEMAMEHDQILKRTMYESSIHVPMIITGPEVKKGLEIENPVSLIDIFPTLMDIADCSTDIELEGESLVPLLAGKSDKRRDWIFSEYHGDRCNTGAYMLRKGNWKYIHYVGYEPLLFNLNEDPWEIDNVAAENTKKVAEFEKLLGDILDYKEVDQKAKKYDKENFRKWRKEHIEIGNYKKIMSEVYSGFDRLTIEDIVPWKKADEMIIEEWLKE